MARSIADFDRYYGLISGGMNYFDITKGKSKSIKRVFARDDKRLTPGGDGFYSTDAFTDEALAMLASHSTGHSGSPFFLYLAFNAPHWPLHAPDELIEKYEGEYCGRLGCAAPASLPENDRAEHHRPGMEAESRRWSGLGTAKRPAETRT